MPPVFLDRLPLPTLQTYTTVSILLFSFLIYYANQIISDAEWNINLQENKTVLEGLNETEPLENVKIMLQNLAINNAITKKLYEIVIFCIEDSLFTWILINMVYCLMILIGKGIQKIVFGELRAIEQQHMKDKFWNFLFYKFIFIFGVMNVQYMEEVLLWCGWFSFVGAFHLLSQLCKDRFEYLSFSPTTPKWTHLRLFALIFFILAVSVSVCIVIGLHASFSTFCFMSAEWGLVTLRTLHVLIRYILHLYDVSHEGIWEKRGVYTYYTELVFELGSNIVDFLHHLHMLFRGNIFLSMATLVICMQLRCLFNEIHRKVIRHKNYLRVSKYMENHYPLASKEELDSNRDDCAICWDQMESARKLPCGHMFHTSCLHSWLEQVTNCPTCRTALANSPSESDENSRNILGQDDIQPRPANQTTNHFFHFDGSRYVSWFPSFSVEVSHTSLLGDRHQIMPSHLDAMVHQVLQMFPHLHYNVVLEDLLLTRSIESTVENILEERLVVPTTTLFPSTTHAVASISSSAPLDLFLGSSGSSSSGSNTNSSTSSSSSSFSNLSTNLQDPTPSVSGIATASSSNLAENELENSQQPSQLSEENILRAGVEGCRFSKSSIEREQMLSQRKEELIRRARNKYVSRSILTQHSGRSSSSSD